MIPALDLTDINLIPYTPFEFKAEHDESILMHDNTAYPVNVFGSHNFSNLKSAFETGKILGLDESDILSSFQTFQGAAKRLEKVYDDKEKQLTVFRDFAHAPSKVKATVKAVRERYADRNIIAVFELHTYSSLQENFIGHYAHSLDAADVCVLYLDEEALKIKNKQDLDEHWLKQQFGNESILVFKDATLLKKHLQSALGTRCVLLLMSSGNFGGLTVEELLA
jgi:UDP-N-acetylmuramate: L-alanyl-gamma-D-glutamyl-meso-diaminopimelate ligase